MKHAHLFFAVLAGMTVAVIPAPSRADDFLVFSKDGQKLAATGGISKSGSSFEVLKIWDTNTGGEVGQIYTPFNRILTAAFTPEGTQLVVSRILKSNAGAKDGRSSLELIDATSGKVVQTFENFSTSEDENEVNTLKVSSDGKYIAGGNFNNPQVVRVWELSSGKRLKKFGDDKKPTMVLSQPLSIRTLAFSPDATCVSSVSKNPDECTVAYWNVNDGKLLQSLRGETPMAVSHCGKLFATAKGKSIEFYDLTTGAKTGMLPPDDKVRNTIQDGYTFAQLLAISPDLKTLAVAEWSGAINLYNIETKERIRTLEGFSQSAEVNMRDLDFSQDGKTLACISEHNAVKLYDIENGSLRQAFRGKAPLIDDVAFTPDGSVLMAKNEVGEFLTLNPTTGVAVKTVTTVPDKFESMALRPDGKALATVTEKGIGLWDIATGKQIFFVPTPKGVKVEYGTYWQSIAFNPSSSLLAAGDSRGTITLWDAKTGQKLAQIGQPKVDHSILALEFSPDGKLLVSGNNFPNECSTKLWDVATKKLIRTLKNEFPTLGIAFVGDSKKVLTSTHVEATCWDVPTGKKLKAIKIGDAIDWFSVSKDGKLFAGASDKKHIKLWNIQTGALMKTLPLNLKPEWKDFKRTVFTPDGKRLAGEGMEPGKVTFWDTATGRILNQ